MQPGFSREGQRCASRPALAVADAPQDRGGRRGDGGAVDRLARSTFDLFAIVEQVTDDGGQFRFLAEPWAYTGISTGRLMLAVLGGLADVDRDLIRARTAEGWTRAKARGQHMGQPPSLTPQQQAQARQRRADSVTLQELADSYNVRQATISRATG